MGLKVSLCSDLNLIAAPSPRPMPYNFSSFFFCCMRNFSSFARFAYLHCSAFLVKGRLLHEFLMGNVGIFFIHRPNYRLEGGEQKRLENAPRQNDKKLNILLFDVLKPFVFETYTCTHPKKIDSSKKIRCGHDGNYEELSRAHYFESLQCIGACLSFTHKAHCPPPPQQLFYTQPIGAQIVYLPQGKYDRILVVI